MEYLGDPLPSTVKLQGIGGRFWTVNLRRKRNAVYFTSGWPNFAEDHDLKDGEFLKFVYDGHRTFEVSVFGLWGFKETRAVAEMIQIFEYESDEGDSMDCDDYEETETVSNVVDIEGTPSFLTTLKNRSYELLISATVVKDHDLTFGESIKYIDKEGTLKGQRGKWADDRVCFKGWDRICRKNRLTKDDTVRCDLLHHHMHVHSIRVYVMRGVASA